MQFLHTQGRLFEPLGDEAVVGMYVDLTQGSSSGIDELVRYIGRSDQHLSCPRHNRLIADRVCRLPLQNDEYFRHTDGDATVAPRRVSYRPI